ncbi:MAG: hypothetical protein KYX62_14285 [Pseudomonadota bacterium]|nr:hypothetical protein [Pseudomonadota bacterium]
MVADRDVVLSHCRGYTALRVVAGLLLLTVLVIAVLTAFQRLLADAQRIQIQATSMSLRTSVLQAHEQWFATGDRQQAQVLKKFAAGNVVVSAQGWPVDVQQPGGEADIRAEIHSAERCERLWRALLLTAVNQENGSYRAATYEGRCRFVFTDPHRRLNGEAFIDYSATDGRVTLTIR